MTAHFRDRRDAGRQLARELSSYAGQDAVRILALPRGGVPVAYEVAQRLRLPLDVFLVRKLGLPWREELAMGAVASGGIVVVNDDVVRAAGIRAADLERVVAAERRELERREQRYRGDRPLPAIAGSVVILVDDGLATGSSMRVGIAAIKQKRPARIVVAVPIASAETCDAIRPEVDEIVCAVTPEPFHAVGLWYEDFSQTTDEEVLDLLGRAARERPAPDRDADVRLASAEPRRDPPSDAQPMR